jgi:hypothetical protein
MKVKPPTAASSVLAMASVLSAVSGAFSTQGGASSVVSDTDEEDQQNQDNVWNHEALSQSKVKSPIQDKSKTKPVFQSYRDGAMRDEIEIEIQTKNGKKFTGSITPLEIKYNIYINALKFPDHENFDGARVGFKGKLVATIKLIEPINIDDLADVEFFEFTRTSSVRGKQTEELIGCKIKGVRWQPNTVSAFETPKPDDERTVVKLEGCDYQVPEEQILTWLSHYGEIKSELEEDLFKDTNLTGGNNRTGNYSIMMILEHKIPQLLPMNGRRVKIYHKGIEKLCTNCFDKHKKSECKAEKKKPWIDYVREFMTQHDYIPVELYGRWNDLVKTTNTFKNHDQTQEQSLEPDTETEGQQEITKDISQNNMPGTSAQSSQQQPNKPQDVSPIPPREEDYGIPTSETEYESMVERMATCGFSRTDLDKILETKRTSFNKATREFRVREKKRQSDETKSTRKTRKNSFSKQT